MQSCVRQAGGLPGACSMFLAAGRICKGAAFGFVAEAGEALFRFPSASCLVLHSAGSMAAAYPS